MIDFKKTLSLQHNNYILWLPVFFAIGIFIYFDLEFEPPLWVGINILIISYILIYFFRKILFGYEKYILFYISIACFGFMTAQVKANLFNYPVVKDSKKSQNIIGRIVKLEQRNRGSRAWIDNLHIEGLIPSNTPKYIRITFRSKFKLDIGDEIKFKARLRPPSMPSIIGGYDFQRLAWFKALGGVGFSFSDPEVIFKSNSNFSFLMVIDKIRENINYIINSTLDKQQAAISIALITGDRNFIDGSTYKIMRDAGLAHLLAISGLHMGLVAGLLFFLIRAGLALSEKLTIYYPIKKYAAFAAIIINFVYLLIAGAPLPTQRAFIMTGLMLFAVICDRLALSMRLVAIAAFIVLFIFPESLFSPSFQMSFAAVIGLVALFDSPASRKLRMKLSHNILTKILGYILALSASTLVASLATMPFAIYHFGRIANYGLAANLIAVPLMAFWVMPFAILAMTLMPFGFAYIGLIPMGMGVGIIIDIAEIISGLPSSYQLVAKIPDISLGLLVIAGLWLCLWRGKSYYFAIILIILAIFIAYFDRKPDIILSQNGKLIAININGVDEQSRQMMLSDTRKGHFERNIWKKYLAFEDVTRWPANGAGKNNGISCDIDGCIYHYQGKITAFPKNQMALIDDCAKADMIISNIFPIDKNTCDNPDIIIDRRDLKKNGGHLIYLNQNSPPLIKTVKAARGDRLWTGK